MSGKPYGDTAPNALSDGARVTAQDPWKARLRGSAGGRVYGALFGAWTSYVSLAALGLSFVLPLNGVGIPLCWFKRMTHLPCPGCGMTRSVTCISHGQLGLALHYHPFGPVLYALGIASVLGWLGHRTGLFPKEALLRFFERHGGVARVVYTLFIVAFIGFGLVRLALCWRDPSRFPDL